jgi:mRNA interferase HigB
MAAGGQEPAMRIFNRATLRKWQAAHADARAALQAWFKVAQAAQWASLHDVRRQYPSADQVDCCLVFDIRGNHYRLICRVAYATKDHGGALYLKHFLTHAQYDTNAWKKDCEE